MPVHGVAVTVITFDLPMALLGSVERLRCQGHRQRAQDVREIFPLRRIPDGNRCFDG